MHLHAFSCLQLQKDPAQLRQLRGVDGLRRDGAVLVAHLSAPEYMIMHLNAAQVECSTFKMHQAENVLECVKMQHV